MKLPFTLRIAYYAFRATIRAGLILMIAWLIFIPANATEVAALGAREGTQYPTGLRSMRVAKIIVKAAPPQAYELIAMAMGPEISPLLVQIAMVQMAAGNVLPESTRRTPANAVDSARDIEGPRFIEVD